MRTMNEVFDLLESTEYEREKFGIFKYDTLDEADPGKERIRRDLTVEIGGPSTHIKFTILTREEHTVLYDAIKKILDYRHIELNEELNRLCRERLGILANKE
jgi:hypothetical protein